ncbi:MAG: Uma2 family endonuclease [Acidobacteria bacterium]|nr:Uma2 family endonuclease [Acidobacteriota bacterium]
MATTLVSVDEYLHTSYDPDCDFVDGVAEERNVGELDHSHLQGELGFWIKLHLRTLGINAFPELRVRVTETRFRVPDVTLLRGKRPATGVLEQVPLAVIEILSPDDRIGRVQARMDDYMARGVPHCWLIDPDTRRAWEYTRGNTLEIFDLVLRCSDPAFEIPLREIFQAIDEQTEA